MTDATTVYISVGSVILLALIIGFWIYRHYVDPQIPSGLAGLVSVFSITISILTLLLIPVDIYNVSNGSIDGFQTDGNEVASLRSIIKTFYIIFLSTMVFNAFFLLPYAYIFYFIDDDNSKRGTRACQWAFVVSILFTSWVTVQYFIVPIHGESEFADLFIDEFTLGDEFLAICLGNMALLGLLCWGLYAAYGLAVCPTSLIRNIGPAGKRKHKTLPEDPKAKAEREAREKEMKDRERIIKDCEENIKQLLGKEHKLMNGTPPQELHPKDKRLLKSYMRKKRHRSRSVDILREEGEQSKKMHDLSIASTTGAHVRFDPQKKELSCCDKVWNYCGPCRKVIGVLFIILSWLVASSMLITSMDRYLNSVCGADCAYILPSPNWFNPLDEMFDMIDDFYPADLVVYVIVILYIFLCAVFGMAELGIRCFGIRVHRIAADETLQQGIIMIAWFLAFFVSILYYLTLVISPSYASFGTQVYLSFENATQDNSTQDNATQQKATQTLFSEDCDLQYMTDDVCVLTSIGDIIYASNTLLPIYGTILMVGSAAFYLFFFVFSIYGFYLIPKPKTDNYGEYEAIPN